jgi:transcriptional regulator with XRE-family HTH domain
MKKQDQILPQHKEMLEEIGERLRKIRKEKKLNGEDAAKNIGISLKTLYPMERGEINFQFTTLLQMLDYYGVSVFDFFIKSSKA